MRHARNVKAGDDVRTAGGPLQTPGPRSSARVADWVHFRPPPTPPRRTTRRNPRAARLLLPRLPLWQVASFRTQRRTLPQTLPAWPRVIRAAAPTPIPDCQKAPRPLPAPRRGRGAAPPAPYHYITSYYLIQLIT